MGGPLNFIGHLFAGNILHYIHLQILQKVGLVFVFEQAWHCHCDRMCTSVYTDHLSVTCNDHVYHFHPIGSTE